MGREAKSSKEKREKNQEKENGKEGKSLDGFWELEAWSTGGAGGNREAILDMA